MGAQFVMVTNTMRKIHNYNAEFVKLLCTLNVLENSEISLR